MSPIDGPRLAPRSGGRPDALVVLLHGYGADGRDLIDIGEAWGTLLPRAAFVAPHAPEPCAEAPVGRQWFPLTFRDPHELTRGVAHAAPGLVRVIDEELARLGLPWSRLGLMGFSQGCMMALEIATQGPQAPAGVVGYSGLWVHAEAREPVPLRHAPPILLWHGGQDQVIPPQALLASAGGLAASGAAVEWHLSPDLGHGIDEAGLAAGGEFLARLLG